MPTKQAPFQIGLCMAGAVSAGAYTAGVMDFLIEALDRWESRRGEAGVPDHRVEIPIMGGASAGGMTTAITASVLRQNFSPMELHHLGQNPLADFPKNPFYHSWVDLEGPDMFEQMLAKSDLREKVPSLLNGNFIERVAKRMIGVENPTAKRPYFSKELEFFLTLTNLEGFEKAVNFRTSTHGIDPHLLNWHSDFACFRISDQEGEAIMLQRAAANYDGWIPINFADPQSSVLNTLRHAAMATGAFPGGLPQRSLTRQAQDINKNPWIVESDLPPGEYRSQHVDGGVINNEPFERVRERLLIHCGQSIEEADDFSRSKGTTLLIDPFPSKEKNFQVDTTLLSSLSQTLGAMLGQLRIKNEVMDSAYEQRDIFRYLIAPSRKIKDELYKGEKALACGFLGGFGGFLHKEFRQHDFFLGRANCERFLRKYFCVPVNPATGQADNPIFKEGYAEVNREDFYIDTSTNGQNSRSLPIIPIFTDKHKQFPLPRFGNGRDWPSQAGRYFPGTFEKSLKKRAAAIIAASVKEANWGTRFLVGIGNRVVLRRMLARKILARLESDLSDWQLLH